MSDSGSQIEGTIAGLRKRFGDYKHFGRSKRLFQFGNYFTCSINYSRELRGPKYFYGLSTEVLDPSAAIPATRGGHFVLLVCGHDGAVLWLPRSIVLQAMRGVTSRKLDVFQEDGRYVLQTTGHSKLDVTEYLNASVATPTEPVAHEDIADKGRVHSEIQIGLAKLGRAEGCRVWVPPGDRNIQWQEQSLRDLTCDRLPSFGFDESTRRVVSNIDVLWLDGKVIIQAFEVEATTSIYSGLLRLNDLILGQPNNRIALVIAAEANRKMRVAGQILRPTFATLLGQCGFISFADIRAAVVDVEGLQKRGVTRVHGLLKAETLTPPSEGILSIDDVRL